jgi:hypothetical protein
MPHPNAAKGRRFELATAVALREYGFTSAMPTRDGYSRDQGDIEFNKMRPGNVVIQCKDVAKPTWDEWFKKLNVQMANAGARHGTLVIKQRGKSHAGEAFAITQIPVWERLAQDSGMANEVQYLEFTHPTKQWAQWIRLSQIAEYGIVLYKPIGSDSDWNSKWAVQPFSQWVEFLKMAGYVDTPRED